MCTRFDVKMSAKNENVSAINQRDAIATTRVRTMKETSHNRHMVARLVRVGDTWDTIYKFYNMC